VYESNPTTPAKVRKDAAVRKLVKPKEVQQETVKD
jgi:hypothetical protein